jgi:hypothetical protein
MNAQKVADGGGAPLPTPPPPFPNQQVKELTVVQEKGMGAEIPTPPPQSWGGDPTPPPRSIIQVPDVICMYYSPMKDSVGGATSSFLEEKLRNCAF